MQKNNVTLKVAVGYTIVALVMAVAMALVYVNTTSLLEVNRTTQEYVRKRDAADSTMSALLKEEQTTLRQLAEALKKGNTKNYLHEKVRDLNAGRDSVVVQRMTPQVRQAENTTVEVVKTKKGFFNRLADAFRKEHAETISVKRDRNAVEVDSVAAPVNVAEDVADILEEIDRQEKSAARSRRDAVSKEMQDLQLVNAQLAIRSAKQLGDVYRQERDSMQQTIDKAMETSRNLLWQIALLAAVAIATAIVLSYYIWRDTQRERIYREDLEEANEKIQRAMDQRERLLLTITHDIKAPAASISGYIDLMTDYVDNEYGRSCLQNIKHSATHLSQLVASLLDYQRLENGMMEVHPVTFRPSDLVQECVDGIRPRAAQKSLEVICTADIPDAMYSGDAFRIRQILDNLLGNAVKYTDEGVIDVSASVSAANVLTVAVKDTGRGMTYEETQKAFRAFTRLDSSHGVDGTGLGLSITQELAKLLGGRILLQSAVGKGSTFTVTIPLTKTSVAAQTADDTEVAPTADAVSTVSVISEEQSEQDVSGNKKILILDDDELQLKLLQEMLNRIVDEEWTVFPCSHVSEALTVLHDEHPSFMLTDIEMPEMNGVEMIKHINHAHMKVVAMTAHDESVLPSLKEAGFDDCLFKPFTIEKLEAILGIKGHKEDGPTVALPNSQTAGQADSPIASLLAFADGDAEAERQLLDNLRQEMKKHLTIWKNISSGATQNRDEIARAAHKLLPTAAMLQWKTVEQLQALSPEHIATVGDESQLRTYAAAVVEEITSVLSAI